MGTYLDLKIHQNFILQESLYKKKERESNGQVFVLENRVEIVDDF